MNALKPYKRKNRGLPDYLAWGHLIAPGVVANKDGSLLAGRFFKGRNLLHATEEDWYAISESANRALGKLTGGWSVWVDGNRLPVSRFTDPARNHFPPGGIAELIEAERRATMTEEGACFDSECALLLHYMPPLKHKGMLVDLFYDQDNASRPTTATAVLNSFQHSLDEFDDQLSAAATVRPMEDRRWVDEHGHNQLRSDLVNYLYFCVSGELVDISLPPDGCYLDGVIGELAVDPGEQPHIGDNYVAIVGVSGYPWPSASVPGAFTGLDMLSFPLRWSTRYVVLDQPEAEKQGQLIEKKWKQKARGLKGLFLGDDVVADSDAAKMSADAKDMVERTQASTEGTGYYTANIILMDPDLDVVLDRARIVRKVIQTAGYPTRLETLNAMEAWLGSLAAHCVPNVRRPPVHSTNLADLLPLSSAWQGQETVPCPMYLANSPPLIQAVIVGSTPIDVGLHVGDLGNCIDFGPPGSGKSTLQALKAAQFLRYSGATVWGFDKGRSLMPIYRANGQFYDIGTDNVAFCPLSILDTDSDLVEAEKWIADCFHLQMGTPPLPIHTEDIHRAIISLSHSTGRSISHFLRQVQNQDVRDAMAYYSLKGPVGYLFDAEKDGLSDNLVCGFEISQLIGMGEKTLLPAFRYITHRFARMLKGQPGLLQISEVWTMFGHPVMKGRVFEWLKELRKLNVCVSMDTQSLSDAERSGILDVLLENCQTRFYGANPAAMTGTEEEPGPRQMYHKFGLNDAQIEMVRQAIPKRHYLYQNGADAALVDFRLGKTALKFLGSTSKEDLARIDRLYRDYGDEWPKHWLNSGRPKLLT